jgi:hypothetical protein
MASIPVGKFPILLGLKEHPLHIVKMFVNRGAFIHVPMGILCGLLNGGALQIGAFSFFAAYEISYPAVGKSWADIGGAFAEFGLGCALTGILRCLT